MAYRKTDKVLAHMAAQKDKIIEAGIALIAKHGNEGLTTEALAERSKMSVGNLYKYFPDLDQLRAAIVQRFINFDLDRICNPMLSLEGAIEVFYRHLPAPRLVRFLRDAPAHSEAIIGELERRIKLENLGLPPKARRMAAGAALGAIYGFYDVSPPSANNAPAVSAFVLRGLGVAGMARRIRA